MLTEEQINENFQKTSLLTEMLGRKLFGNAVIRKINGNHIIKSVYESCRIVRITFQQSYDYSYQHDSGIKIEPEIVRLHTWWIVTSPKDIGMHVIYFANGVMAICDIQQQCKYNKNVENYIIKKGREIYYDPRLNYGNYENILVPDRFPGGDRRKALF